MDVLMIFSTPRLSKVDRHQDPYARFVVHGVDAYRLTQNQLIHSSRFGKNHCQNLLLILFASIGYL
jgi:hypothetical protein